MATAVSHPPQAATMTAVQRPRWGWEGMALPLVLIAFLHVLEPAWLGMWLLAMSTYMACKWLSWRQAARERVPFWRHAAYLIAWPGLDASAFLRARRDSARAVGFREWLFAISKLMLGVIVVSLAVKLPDRDIVLRGWLGMIGIVLVLHFGLFHCLSCMWRSIGVSAQPLMQWPLAATSLADFWGRRWNTAFRDLTHRFLFRPLVPYVGNSGALWGSFFFSGIVHDLVISLPALGGYGGPTLYFLIQAAGIAVQRSSWSRNWRLDRGLTARLFTATILLGPVTLLFHRPFIKGVIVPFVDFLGAWL